MKTNNIKYFGLIILFSASFKLSAQEYKQELVVPLSKPGERGSLDVGLIKGSINVEGYDGKELIIIATGKDLNIKNRESSNDNTEGLKKISSGSFELDVEERNNNVEISGDNFGSTIDLDIKVPTNFSLKLKTINNGIIKVTNVDGDHEISNINGDIEMFAISGSAVVSNVNGKIEIVFDKVNPDKPMSFVNLNKNIDITLPANAKATLKMTSRMGEIYTDFDVELVKADPEVKKSSGNEIYRVEIGKYLIAKLNGGGTEYNFKNFTGNIVIRKKK